MLFVDDTPEDHHLLRRLGRAVILAWGSLPEEIQRDIRTKAIMVHDDHQTVQLAQQIDQLIRRVQESNTQ